MRFNPPNVGRTLALMASFLIGGPAMAAEFSAPHDSPLAMNFPAMQLTWAPAETTAETPVSDIAGMGPAVSASTLGALRGGDDVDNDVTLVGQVNNNTADRIVSGSNTIQDGALANASGLSTVIQNTGSNVLIQNGTVVNVQFVVPGL